eukprot:6586153-Prymnesium_polylepis.2
MAARAVRVGLGVSAAPLLAAGPPDPGEVGDVAVAPRGAGGAHEHVRKTPEFEDLRFCFMSRRSRDMRAAKLTKARAPGQLRHGPCQAASSRSATAAGAASHESCA